MTQDQWKEWKESPATEYFLKYLKDSVKEESSIVAETIASGGTLDVEEQIRIATICETLNRIADIELEEIEEFYEET